MYLGCYEDLPNNLEHKKEFYHDNSPQKLVTLHLVFLIELSSLSGPISGAEITAVSRATSFMDCVAPDIAFAVTTTPVIVG